MDIRQWLLPDCEVVGFDGGDTPLEHSVFSSFSRFRIQDFPIRVLRWESVTSKLRHQKDVCSEAGKTYFSEASRAGEAQESSYRTVEKPPPSHLSTTLLNCPRAPGPQ